VSAVARFAIGLLLARLLTPADFGLVALAFVVTGFAQPIGDLGIGGAIIQRRTITPRHLRAAFTLSVLIGFGVALALAAAAAPIAALLRDERVGPVLRVVASSFAVQGFSVTASGVLRRRLDFRRLFFIETGSYVVGYGGVAVLLATLGYGVWSLVAAVLVQTLVSCVAQLASARHPVRPLFARGEWRDLLHFGIGSGASSWINYLAMNADDFIVGRTLGVASLGLYARAFGLMNLPFTYVVSAIGGVLFPAFAQLQDDRPRLRRAYLTATRLTALIVGGGMSTMAVSAPYLVPALYGPRWIGVVPPLQILCAAGYFRALYHVGGVVAHSVGLVYSDLKRQAFYAALVIAGSLAGAAYGLRGIALGVSVAILAMFIATGQLALRITGTSWNEYARIQFAPLSIAIVSGACAFGARAVLARSHARDGIVAGCMLVAASVPWSAGALWVLGSRDLQSVCARLPRWCRRMVAFVRDLSFTTA
jgi:O-antigen/teichoic acid export membrane protein